MLNDAVGFKHAYAATGKTDLRKVQDSLIMIIKIDERSAKCRAKMQSNQLYR